MTLNGTAYRLESLTDTFTREIGFFSYAQYPTPAAHEARLGYQRRPADKKGTQRSLSTVVIDELGGREKVDGHLNPEWVEWLMGFPIGFTDCTQ